MLGGNLKKQIFQQKEQKQPANVLAREATCQSFSFLKQIHNDNSASTEVQDV